MVDLELQGLFFTLYMLFTSVESVSPVFLSLCTTYKGRIKVNEKKCSLHSVVLIKMFALRKETLSCVYILGMVKCLEYNDKN